MTITDHERDWEFFHTYTNENARYVTFRSDLTEAEKAEAARIGRIEFKSAGATRKR